jgi:hypothetical protein
MPLQGMNLLIRHSQGVALGWHVMRFQRFLDPSTSPLQAL